MKLIECPRDAMQGIKEFIPTQKKIDYLNQLLKVGFDTIDFGSFVSPRAIPQMADTQEVLAGLDLKNTDSKLLGIVANLRGAVDASKFPEIDYLGYPFSVSETFQKRNTNANIEESLKRIEDILAVCKESNKTLVVYVSMGFGNPYGDPWSVEVVQKWVDILADMGVKILSMSDTIGVADEKTITYLFGNLIPPYPDVEFGAHLHTAPHNWLPKIKAAYQNGCKRFDGAIGGYGGCPMAKDDLTGNMAMEHLLQFFEHEIDDMNMNLDEFGKSIRIAKTIFPAH